MIPRCWGVYQYMANCARSPGWALYVKVVGSAATSRLLGSNLPHPGFWPRSRWPTTQELSRNGVSAISPQYVPVMPTRFVVWSRLTRKYSAVTLGGVYSLGPWGAQGEISLDRYSGHGGSMSANVLAPGSVHGRTMWEAKHQENYRNCRFGSFCRMLRAKPGCYW